MPIAALASLTTYTVLFTILAFPWLRDAHWAHPKIAPLLLISDARLWIYILDWCARTLWTDPRHLFDLPIFFPVPGQLAGSEHLLASQILYTPLLPIVGDPIAAANWTAFLLFYPLGAFAMERLARMLGASRQAAWLSGLAFALGPLLVPANLQALQYPPVFLPLAYSAIVCLRERPTAGRTAALAAVLTLGVFSSYYMAAVLGLFVVLAAAVEALFHRGRARWIACAIAGVAIAYGALALVSRPYYARADAVSGTFIRMVAGAFSLRVHSAFVSWVFGFFPLLAAVVGLLAFFRADIRTRRVAGIGVAFALTGTLLALGPSIEMYGMRVPLPFAILGHTPASFVRVPLRFVVIAGFGIALLVAAAFDTLVPARQTRSGPRLLLFVAVGIGFVALRGRGLVPDEHTPITAPALVPVFKDFGRTMAAQGGGALLELPALDRLGMLDSDAMIHALFHGAPLVNGYTGYPSTAQREFLERTLKRLPDANAVDALVDATHVRWLLLKPPGVMPAFGGNKWPRSERDRYVTTLERTNRAALVSTAGQWILMRFTRDPR